MDEATFQTVVGIARQTIREETEFWGSTPAEGMALLYKRRSVETQEAFLRDLIWCSDEIAVAWDSLKLIARDLLRGGESLPAELAEWLAGMLAEEKLRPTRKGQDPDGQVFRNRAIMVAVRYLTKLGFKATRNIRQKDTHLPHCCFEGGSACDVVGVAEGMNYKAVERIWANSASPESPIYRFAYRQVPRLSYSNPENK